MQCPIDQTDLVMTERQGVEIDYCPKCRGVWLDRGELDKIIERSAEFDAGGSLGKGQFETPEVGGLKGRVQQLDSRDRYEDDRRRVEYDDDDDDRYRRDDRQHGKRKKKRGSFLEDLFDFG